MNTGIQRVYQEAMRLAEEDRAKLVAWLINSLDQEVDEEAQLAWDKEVKQRIEELETGALKTIPWSKARRIILGLDDGL